MPCPHNEITIVQRSQRQSAVAAAAYQSGGYLVVKVRGKLTRCKANKLEFVNELLYSVI